MREQIEVQRTASWGRPEESNFGVVKLDGLRWNTSDPTTPSERHLESV